MFLEWDIKNSDYDWDDEEGWSYIRESSFFSIVKGAYYSPKIGFYKLKYDGYPYKILSFGIFKIVWGKRGYWEYLNN